MVFQTQRVHQSIHSGKPDGTYDKDKCQKQTFQTDQVCNSSQLFGDPSLEKIIKGGNLAQSA